MEKENSTYKQMLLKINNSIEDYHDERASHTKATILALIGNDDLMNEFESNKNELEDFIKAYNAWNDANERKDNFLAMLVYRSISSIYETFVANKNEEISKKFYITYQMKRNFLLQESVNDIISYDEDMREKMSGFDISEFLQKRKEIDELFTQLNDEKQRFNVIIGDIAENKNAGKYKEYYENCRKSAFWLFWASLAIMISTAITVTYNCVAYGMLDQSDFSGLLSRISLTALVLLPSFFMMREAKKLKDKEFQYYDMMCRIVTSAPYIDGLTHLDDNQKDRMKADLVKDFFTRPIECRDDGGLVPIEEICKILKTCIGEK